ncbi:MAG TPA: hypothetical protein VK572_16530 [Burkholderiales bacterium]|nr:hypothetical protein [Burkholderiales bacterium]
MDTILNLIAAAGIWSSITLLAWGGALTLKQVFCATGQAPLTVQLGDMRECRFTTLEGQSRENE